MSGHSVAASNLLQTISSILIPISKVDGNTSRRDFVVRLQARVVSAVDWSAGSTRYASEQRERERFILKFWLWLVVILLAAVVVGILVWLKKRQQQQALLQSSTIDLEIASFQSIEVAPDKVNSVPKQQPSDDSFERQLFAADIYSDDMFPATSLVDSPTEAKSAGWADQFSTPLNWHKFGDGKFGDGIVGARSSSPRSLPTRGLSSMSSFASSTSSFALGPPRIISKVDRVKIRSILKKTPSYRLTKCPSIVRSTSTQRTTLPDVPEEAGGVGLLASIKSTRSLSPRPARHNVRFRDFDSVFSIACRTTGTFSTQQSDDRDLDEDEWEQLQARMKAFSIEVLGKDFGSPTAEPELETGNSDLSANSFTAESFSNPWVDNEDAYMELVQQMLSHDDEVSGEVSDGVLASIQEQEAKSEQSPTREQEDQRDWTNERFDRKAADVEQPVASLSASEDSNSLAVAPHVHELPPSWQVSGTADQGEELETARDEGDQHCKGLELAPPAEAKGQPSVEQPRVVKDEDSQDFGENLEKAPEAAKNEVTRDLGKSLVEAVADAQATDAQPGELKDEGQGVCEGFGALPPTDAQPTDAGSQDIGKDPETPLGTDAQPTDVASHDIGGALEVPPTMDAQPTDAQPGEAKEDSHGLAKLPLTAIDAQPTDERPIGMKDDSPDVGEGIERVSSAGTDAQRTDAQPGEMSDEDIKESQNSKISVHISRQPPMTATKSAPAGFFKNGKFGVFSSSESIDTHHTHLEPGKSTKHTPAPKLEDMARNLLRERSYSNTSNRTDAGTFNKEAEATHWIEELTGESRGDMGFCEWLKDGRILCTLANFLQPGIIPKVHTSQMPYKRRDNISSFLSACTRLGVADKDLFGVDDLFNESNEANVWSCICRLGSVVKLTVEDFHGPYIEMPHSASPRPLTPRIGRVSTFHAASSRHSIHGSSTHLRTQ